MVILGIYPAKCVKDIWSIDFVIIKNSHSKGNLVTTDDTCKPKKFSC